MSQTTRRSFLEVMGLVTGGLMLRRSPLGNAFAQTAEPKYLLMVYFDGGWDQLLTLDPRNASQSQFQRIGGVSPTSRIEPAYVEYAKKNAFIDAVMAATGGAGIQNRGNLSFGPAMPTSMMDHASDLCVIRGLNMDTVTHEVGRRYLLTGKFPRGLMASGSSLNTVVTAALGAPGDIPNLAIGTESYNQELPPSASAIGVRTYADLLAVMEPQAGVTLPAASEAAVRHFEDTDDTCLQHGYDGAGLVQAFKSGRQFSRQLAQPSKSALFDFKIPMPADLGSAFGISSAADLSSMRARAAVAGQALVNGVSNVVSVTLADQLDSHFEIFDEHAATQRDGWDALGKLIAFLKSKSAPGTTKSVWQCTSMLVFSEFSRTPLINTRDGRDHHVTSSCLLAGPGIKGDTVFGAASAVGMLSQKWDFATGALRADGATIRPVDVHATLLDSMGLSYAHVANQNPRLIAPIRR